MAPGLTLRLRQLSMRRTAFWTSPGAAAGSSANHPARDWWDALRVADTRDVYRQVASVQEKMPTQEVLRVDYIEMTNPRFLAVRGFAIKTISEGARAGEWRCDVQRIPFARRNSIRFGPRLSASKRAARTS